MGHRPYDYHPDHRYTGVLMDDTAVVVVAPFFVPDTPPTKRNPVYMYYSDSFLDPKPFTPTLVVGIDDVAEKKWKCISAMPSQFGDKDSWQARTLPNVPQSDGGDRRSCSTSSRPAQCGGQSVSRSPRRAVGRSAARDQVCGSVSALAMRASGVVDELKAMFPTLH
jgi:hypothetical protein